jgi:hypothetical protein
MDTPLDPLDTFVLQLLRSTGGSRMFPEQITPVGIKRRLTTLRARYGREPTWEDPAVNNMLVRMLARRIGEEQLPLVLDAWVSQYHGVEKERLMRALGHALATDHPLAHQGSFKAPGIVPPANLLVRLVHSHESQMDQWAKTWPETEDDRAAYTFPEPFEAWRRWVMVGARQRVAQGEPLPGEPGIWATVLRAHQASERADDADLRWLLAQRPELAGVGHREHPEWPVLASALLGPLDTQAADHLLAHPQVLRRNVAVHWRDRGGGNNPWLTWPTVFPHEDQGPNTLPVWALMVLQNHPASDALLRHATPAEKQRLDNLHVVCQVTQHATGVPALNGLSKVIRQAPAWADPTTLSLPSMNQTGDPHPLWVGVMREPRLLGERYERTPYLPDFRNEIESTPHLLQATNDEGANLWWVFPGLRRNVDAVRDGLGFLARNKVFCQPDRFGRGLFYRYPNWTHVLMQGQTGGLDDIIQNYTENPFWDSMHRDPKGFFGATEEGQIATAKALWKHAESALLMEWDKVQDRTFALLLCFDQQRPEAFHPAVRLLVTTALAMVHHHNGKGGLDLAQWAPDPTDPTVVALMDHPYYRHVAEYCPELTATMRQTQATQTASPVNPRRRPRA